MKIFVDCVNCGKEFDILTAKGCSHQNEERTEGTKVCPHCEKCACDALAPFDSTEHEIIQLEPSIQGVGYLIVKKEFLRE